MDISLKKEFEGSFPTCFVSGNTNSTVISNCSHREGQGGVMSGVVFLCRDPKKSQLPSGICPQGFPALSFDEDEV